MEFNPPSEKPSEPIREIAREILLECRKHVDKYDSPAGIHVAVGEIVWTVTYWPEREESTEKLTVTRDTGTYKNPASYILNQDGLITKNETILKGIPGGVYFDPEHEQPVDNVDELEIVKAIVMAAHSLRNE